MEHLKNKNKLFYNIETIYSKAFSHLMSLARESHIGIMIVVVNAVASDNRDRRGIGPCQLTCGQVDACYLIGLGPG